MTTSTEPVSTAEEPPVTTALHEPRLITAPPSAPRLLTGIALRRYRHDSGLSLEDAAAELDCHISKISRIETGQRGIRFVDLRILLDAYRVPEPEQCTLAALTGPRSRYGWWNRYPAIAGDPHQRDYAQLEAAARHISIYEPRHVPALLQTPGYARALAGDDPAAGDEAAQAALARQHVILGTNQPHGTVIISETALHACIGGHSVMRDQITGLADIATGTARLTVQIVPATAAAHAADDAVPMTILTLGPAITAVCLPGPCHATWLTTSDAIGHCRAAFARLRDAALSPGDSARLLQGHTAAHGNTP